MYSFWEKDIDTKINNGRNRFIIAILQSSSPNV
ncbi:uncharacterized protein METZ01_LOCUS160423 [marine metagenome]|uniref:Uncharacterized protein n=1 Tax=marine metagenome TaxID=408172 RepID=A0A382B1I3_9ZZZZ